jgi:rod shape-determining protein MreD
MRAVRYFLIGVLFLYIQILLSPRLVIFDISPFFLLPFIVFIGLNLKMLEALSIAFVIGLGYDLMNPLLLGSHVMLLVSIALIVHRFQGSVPKDKPIPVLITIVVLNLFYLIPLLLIKIVVMEHGFYWLKMAPFELVYNSVMTAIVLAFLIVTHKLRLSIDV